MKKCSHYWSYPHDVWEGRKTPEIAVVRYCHICSKMQMAFTGKWGKISKNYDIHITEFKG